MYANGQHRTGDNLIKELTALPPSVVHLSTLRRSCRWFCLLQMTSPLGWDSPPPAPSLTSLSFLARKELGSSCLGTAGLVILENSSQPCLGLTPIPPSLQCGPGGARPCTQAEARCPSTAILQRSAISKASGHSLCLRHDG